MTIAATNRDLSSPAEFPLFVSSIGTAKFSASATSSIIRYFGWKRLAVIYEIGGEGSEVYEAMRNISSEIGLNFTNSEHLRGVAQGITNNITLELNATIIDIMKSTTRIILILHIESGSICEAMYDLGIRSEYLIVGTNVMAAMVFNRNGTRFEKRRIVAKGALGISTRYFIGTVGQRVLSKLRERDGDELESYSCPNFDSAMLYVYATQYLISQGFDYEDPYSIVGAMRNTHFQGCTGLMGISPGTNNRASTEMSVSNMKTFNGNKSVSLNNVLYYNPFSVTLFSEVGEIVWPDNSTGVFLDTFVSTFDCPFLESQIRDYPTGRIIGSVAVVFMCVLVLATVLVVRIVWRRVNYPLLVSRVELSANDVMQMIVVPLEVLQLSVLGPESKNLNAILSTIAKLTSLQLDIAIDSSGDRFWHVLFISLGLAGGYVSVCAVKFLKVEEKLEEIPLCTMLLVFVDLLLPAFSCLLYIPITSTIVQLFFCYESSDGSLTNSFLNRDCYTYCWTGIHVPFAACGAVALIVYIPTAIYSWPIWQELHPLLHIKIQPRFLVSKSILYTTLVAASGMIKNDFPEVHAAVFFFALVSLIALSIWFPPYNYNRLNLWYVIGAVIVVTFGAFSLTSRYYPESSFIWFILFTSCLGFYLAAGVLLQVFVKSFKGLLFRRRMKTENIIKFAFSFGSRALYFLEAHFNDSYFTEFGLQPRVFLSN